MLQGQVSLTICRVPAPKGSCMASFRVQNSPTPARLWVLRWEGREQLLTAVQHLAVCTRWKVGESGPQPRSPDSEQPCAFHCRTPHSRNFKHEICLLENVSFGLSYAFYASCGGADICCFACLVIFFFFLTWSQDFWLPFRIGMEYFFAVEFSLHETISQVLLPSPVRGLGVWPKFCNLSLSVWSRKLKWRG